jgi:hypothetical protein
MGSVAVGARLSTPRLGPLAGKVEVLGSYRTYRQSGQPIASQLVPVVAAGPRLAVRVGQMRISLDGSAGVDLIGTELVVPERVPVRLSPLELRAALSLRFDGAGDPNGPLVTSTD